ncbi:hypothetical protein LCGC14_1707910 [marine sediment metagenome]|uniref:Phosphoadenosine phosphosulphate reductase domain-containing protein n=1 Tax=marine sediment metagenome TaxID=412755 RepID=A0A0F9KG58_9ZZZZ
MTPAFHEYDHIIVAFSGGKDSTACVLHLLDQGVDPDKIELWHHLVDGREGSTLMDWPVTEDYCRKLAKALGLPIFFSWKEGGFEREMLKKQQRTAPNHFEHIEDNVIECGIAGGTRGKVTTREKFPQVSADLSVRWCSAYLKIDVCTMAIKNQERFINASTLVVSGERAEESPARENYKEFEIDRADTRTQKSKRRRVDRWRPVHKWTEKQVWAIIERHGIMPHPAYRLGWGRLSCMSCIFGSNSQWASVNMIAPDHINTIAEYERKFGVTIHRTESVLDRIANASPYKSIDPTIAATALRREYYGPIIVTDWELPAGAFGESSGPS